MSRSLRIAVSVGLSALFLAFAVRRVNWSDAWAALAAAHYLYALPIYGITVWSLYIRAQRWRVLLRPIGTPSMRTLVAATNIGFMANTVLPLRAGEVIRPVLVSRKEREPLGGILATIVLERIFDMFTILCLFGASTIFVSVSAEARHWGYRLCGVAALIGAAVVFIRWQEALALRVLRVALRPLPERVAGHVDHFFRGFIRALEILQSPLTFVQVLGWSFYLWLVIALIYLLGLWQFDLPVPAVTGGILVTAMVAIAVSVPSAPGAIGAFQLGCVLALAIFGVSQSDAIAYSIVVQVTQFVGVISAGLYSLAREGMTMRQIEDLSEADGATA